MLELITLASSSRGNCHLLKGDSESILLDFGISLNNDLDIYTDYNLQGILLTHGHKDHIGGLTGGMNMFGDIDTYGNKETLDKVDVFDFKKHIVNENKLFTVGTEFKIIPFSVPHDFKCLAYMIKHIPSNTNFLYMTDTGMASQLTVKDVDFFLVECNYDETWYNDIEEEDTDWFKYCRLVGGKGHISLQQCSDFLQRNINHNTKKVILCHISRSYEDYDSFRVFIQENINRSDIEVKALNNHIRKRDRAKTVLLDTNDDIMLEDIE